jgi:adenylate cyclase
MEVLNRVLTMTTKCVIDNGGTLDKFIGDATMAIWGAPLEQEDYTYKAARAGLSMTEGIKAVNIELSRDYGVEVSLGVGIHTGEVIVGNIGAPMRMDYTAIGDVVNTASRLESVAKGGEVYISADVAQTLIGRIETKPLPPLQLRGKANTFEAFSLIGYKDGGK